MKGRKAPTQLDNCGPKQSWEALTGPNAEMDEQMYAEFITKTLGLPEDSIIQFYLMTVGMECPKLGHIKYENFTNLFKFCGNCKTIKELKKIIPKMEKDLQDPRSFKKMYRAIFQTFLIKSLTMDFEFAQALWDVLLRKDFVYLKQFQQYLDHLGAKKPTKCHKDLWNMLYEFATVVKDIKKDYSESDAWPVFIDNFVEWMQEENKV